MRYQLCDLRDCRRIALRQAGGRAVCQTHFELHADELEAEARAREEVRAAQERRIFTP